MATRRVYRFVPLLCIAIGVRGELFGQQIIRGITFERMNVFDVPDSTTPAWFKSLVNTFHVTSRESLLRNEILFREGDTLRPALLAESERKLRRLGFVGDVGIGPDANGDSGTVIVRTHDYWSLTPNASYKNDGGFQQYGVSLSESNFLGTGDQVYGGTDYSTARTKRFGTQFFFVGKHLPFPTWESTFQYKSAEELTIRTLSVTRPFFSEEAPLSFGVYADDGTALRRTYRDGLVSQQEEALQRNQAAWAVASVGGDTKYRIGLSFTHRTTSGVVALARNDDRLTIPMASLGIIRRTWEKTSGLNTLTRVEDVPTGFSLDLIAGRNFVYPSNTFLVGYWLAHGVAAATVGGSTYVSPQVLVTRTGPTLQESEATVQYSLLIHHRPSPNDLIILRVSGTQGYHWPMGEEMILGSPTGLRGYGQYAFAGNRMVLFNAESRHVFSGRFWIFHLGAAMFADCGAVWNDPQEVWGQKFHSSVGLGIRIENTKQQGLGFIRIDIPYLPDRHRMGSITISSTHFLEAFTDFDSIPPHF